MRARSLALVVGLVLLAWVVPPASPLAGFDRRPGEARKDRPPGSTVVAVEIRDGGPGEPGAESIQECSVTYHSARSQNHAPAEPGAPARTTVLRISIRHESAREATGSAGGAPPRRPPGPPRPKGKSKTLSGVHP